MIEVKEEIYYHINTGKMVKEKDILEIGARYNNFYYEIYNTEHLEENKDANEYLLEMRRNNRLTFKDSQIKINW